MKLKFLGTGGGRFTMSAQHRRTAGILVKTEGTQVHLDPGPGALVYSRKELKAPDETEAIIVSHGHVDHYGDAEALIEMMTEHAGNPGVLFGNETVLNGYSDLAQSVSNYHQDLCSRVEKLEDGNSYRFKDLQIRSQQMFHTDPMTQGIKLETDQKTAGFWTDSRFSEELLDFYTGCEVMVINCGVGKDSSSKKHASVRDAVKIAEEIEPNTTILSGFGSRLLSSLEENKEWVEENTDQKIIFAEDGMEFPGNRRLKDF